MTVGIFLADVSEATDILSSLRRKHAQDADGKWYGVDVINGDICDTYEMGIWEPADNKMNSFDAATEAACVILSIDETVIAPPSQDPGAAATGMMGGIGGMSASSKGWVVLY